jgi:hypothetical protein
MDGLHLNREPHSKDYVFLYQGRTINEGGLKLINFAPKFG